MENHGTTYVCYHMNLESYSLKSHTIQAYSLVCVSWPFNHAVAGPPIQKKLDKILKNIVVDHMEKKMTMESRQGELVKDLVDVLLRLQKQGGLEFPITDDCIKTSSGFLRGSQNEVFTDPSRLGFFVKQRSQDDNEKASFCKMLVFKELLEFSCQYPQYLYPWHPQCMRMMMEMLVSEELLKKTGFWSGDENHVLRNSSFDFGNWCLDLRNPINHDAVRDGRERALERTTDNESIIDRLRVRSRCQPTTIDRCFTPSLGHRRQLQLLHLCMVNCVRVSLYTSVIYIHQCDLHFR
ncbi:hypothetical protein LguiA_033599 [Lonicera macranthoides]